MEGWFPTASLDIALSVVTTKEKLDQLRFEIPHPLYLTATRFWIWIYTLQGPFLAIFATELGERNANKTCTWKGWSVLFVILQALFKNWLKHNFVLSAYVWVAAPCSILPTADENAVTESAVTTVSPSLFQSATVRLTKSQLLYCSAVLLSRILKPQEFRISCLAMVLSESQSLKVVGRILLQFLSAGIREFSLWRHRLFCLKVLKERWVVVSHACLHVVSACGDAASRAKQAGNRAICTTADSKQQ